MPINAIMVAVNYTDILRITLPYNRIHFDKVMIVTDDKPVDDIDTDLVDLAVENKCEVHYTNSFTANGATFNKWAALEEGLDVLGRSGWLCIMDADVLWPKHVLLTEIEGSSGGLRIEGDRGTTIGLKHGELCTPLRRMMIAPNELRDVGEGIVPTSDLWKRYPLHPNVNEWAGYSQIFHASDPVLGPPPWHQTDWTHGGGADSMFQAKWPRQRKIRPTFEVLHLGHAGANWCGRATPTLSGERQEKEAERIAAMQTIWDGRKRAGRGKFDQEKVK